MRNPRWLVLRLEMTDDEIQRGCHGFAKCCGLLISQMKDGCKSPQDGTSEKGHHPTFKMATLKRANDFQDGGCRKDDE